MIKNLFEDDFLLIIDKPPGLTVDRSNTQKEPTLEDILKTDFKISLVRGGIVHRLDKNTSGLLVVAKTNQALENLQLQFLQRSVKKKYLSLVHGFLNEAKTADAPIGRNPSNREKFTVLEGGKEAVTEFLPVNHFEMNQESIDQIFPDFNKIQLRKLQTLRYPRFTLLECRPLTGRTHQIRVHLKHLGYVVVGDEKYAGRKVARLDRRWCPRQFLHAESLEFSHPQTKASLIFKSPLPDDLKQALGFISRVENGSIPN